MNINPWRLQKERVAQIYKKEVTDLRKEMVDDRIAEFVGTQSDINLQRKKFIEEYNAMMPDVQATCKLKVQASLDIFFRQLQFACPSRASHSFALNYEQQVAIFEHLSHKHNTDYASLECEYKELIHLGEKLNQIANITQFQCNLE